MTDQELIDRWQQTDNLVEQWDLKRVSKEGVLAGLDPDCIGQGLGEMDEKHLVTEVYTTVRRIEAVAWVFKNQHDQHVAHLSQVAKARIGTFLVDYLAKPVKEMTLEQFLLRQRLEWAKGVLLRSLPDWGY